MVMIYSVGSKLQNFSVEEIISPMSIDCKKMYIFAVPMRRNSSVNESILFRSKNRNFAKILNRGLKQSMLILCIYRLCVSTHRLCVYITAWEYCFFTVHSVKAFGDASVLWT